MTAVQASVVVEGLLDEEVLRRILAEIRRDIEIQTVYGRAGRDHIRLNIRRYFDASRYSVPCIVVVDLDKDECAAALIESWLGGNHHDQFALRIAVHEVESWIMASRERFSSFARVSAARVPDDPDLIPDAKRTLINIVSRSRSRNLREDICPRQGSTAQVGPDYNGRLAEFVRGNWDLEEACSHSDSLRRAVAALRRF